jgi:hypothetical protein
VHTTIYRLTRDEPRFDDALRGFLSKAYNLKGIADYEIGPDAEVSPELARATTQDAQRFVAHIQMLLGEQSPDADDKSGTPAD